jgi:hypothetical protein
MKPTLKEITSVFIEAMKETPRQMLAPLIAAWNEIKDPQSPKDKKADSAAFKKSGPDSSP